MCTTLQLLMHLNLHFTSSGVISDGWTFLTQQVRPLSAPHHLRRFLDAVSPFLALVHLQSWWGGTTNIFSALAFALSFWLFNKPPVYVCIWSYWSTQTAADHSLNYSKLLTYHSQNMLRCNSIVQYVSQGLTCILSTKIFAKEMLSIFKQTILACLSSAFV